MKLASIKKKVERKAQALRRKINSTPEEEIVKVLLLTNRDSDNVGDQVIEVCDISLITAVMKNLKRECRIRSAAASIVSPKYLQTRAPELLASADAAVRQADVVIFGGAPMFNYLYQNFYERTAVTLELAQKYNKPVIFSAIGIEGYSEEDEKCQRVKKALNFECVKQVTTRDDFESLQKYKDNEQMVVEKVSDPAVFSSGILQNYKVEGTKKKKIGIFVLRHNGFVDNKIDFSGQKAAAFWVDLIRILEEKGYDYELLTSGHFADEAFIDYLIRKYNVNQKKCVFNMNSPERLIKKISSYAGVISCRLHPSIISFSLDVPSLGVVWNPKVKGFYESIGYEDRVIETKDICAEGVVEKLEQAIAEGIKKSEEFQMSVYNSLFYGIKRAIGMEDSTLVPFGYEELVKKLPVYEGDSKKERENKLERKFRRTYQKYNDRFEKNESQRKKIKKLEEEIQRLREN